MTLPLARELAAEGIRVNCIAPGLMHTPMMDDLSGPAKQFLVDRTVYPRRLGNADEYAALVVRVTRNTFMNGSVTRLDGAIRMPPQQGCARTERRPGCRCPSRPRDRPVSGSHRTVANPRHYSPSGAERMIGNCNH